MRTPSILPSEDACSTSVETAAANADAAIAPAKLKRSSEGYRLHVTRFASVRSATGRHEMASWASIRRLFANPGTFKSKSACPLFALAQFKEGHKTDAKLLWSSGIVGDYDGKVEAGVSVDDAERMLRAEGVEAILYTTASHAADAPHWRVVLPFSQARRPSEHASLFATAQLALKGCLDPESKTKSRTYYYGKVEGVEYEYRHVEGSPIDLLPAPVGIDEGEREHLPSREVVAVAQDAIETAKRKYSEQAIREMLSSEPNGLEVPRETYRNVLWAARDGLGMTERGLAVFEGAYARRYPENDPEENRKLWFKADREEGTRIDIEWLRMRALDREGVNGALMSGFENLDEVEGPLSERESNEFEGLVLPLDARRGDDQVEPSTALQVLPQASGEELLAQLRGEDPEQILATYVERCKHLSSSMLIEVVDEVHMRTRAPKRMLMYRIKEARRRDELAANREALLRRAGERLPVVIDVSRTAAMADLTEARIVLKARPGEYVSFGNVPAAITVAALPGTHAARSKDTPAPHVPQIEPLNSAQILRKIEKVVVFLGKPDKDGRREVVEVPAEVRNHLRTNPQRAPKVTGLLVHPAVLMDGRILRGAGHDDDTGLFLYGADIDGLRPYSKDEAAAALARIKSGLLGEVAFATPEDADYAVAGLMTCVQRKVLDKAPGLVVLGRRQSSGKTTLVQMFHVTQTGRDIAVSQFPRTEEEMQKRLLSLLLRSPAMIAFDNIADGYTVKSEALATVIGQGLLEQRLLGGNETVTVPTNTVFALTGNNLTLGADEVTRWLSIRVEPRTVRPQERQFKHPDAVAFALSCRNDVIRDIVGIVGGYLASGTSAEVRSRYPQWDRCVRQPLIWAGGADVAEVFRANSEQSEDETSHTGLLTAIGRIFGDDAFTATELGHAAAGYWSSIDVSTSLAKRLRAIPEDEAVELQGLLRESLAARTASDLKNPATLGRVLAKVDAKYVEVDGVATALRKRVSRGRIVYQLDRQ